MKTGRSKTLALWLALAGATAATVVTGVGCHRGKVPPVVEPPDDAQGPIVGNVDLRQVPPGVERATIQKLDRESPDGNALLEVTFERQEPALPKRIRIFPDDTAVVLRDDGAKGDAKPGDGVFSAVTTFDFEQLRTQPALAAKQLSGETPRLIFRGREAIGVEDRAAARARLDRLTKFRDLESVLRDRSKIDLADLVPNVAALNVDPQRSLMITDPTVVTDPERTVDPCGAGNPNGVWTFKHLVTEMVAGTGLNPADFTEHWLTLWTTSQTTSSGFSAPARTAILARVLNGWPRVGGKLDLDRAPFRLSAIVNRIDLGGNLVYGGGSAGEGRFVFGVRDRAARGCTFMPFSVIFEYGVPRKGCSGVRSWAKQWVDLNANPIGSAAYRQALEALTETFAKAGAAPGKPNGSALNQLRTNENALNSRWELREFRLDAATHHLFEDTVKQTPAESLNNTAVIAQFINDPAHNGKILMDAHVVPDRYPGPTNSFMGASSLASGSQLSTHFRAAGITNNDARFHFSLNTCTACHIRETGTTNPNPVPLSNNTTFLHVDPRTMPARLSRFLTGATPALDDSAPFGVTDPVDSSVQHEFNDLDLRRQKLANFAGAFCLNRILNAPRQLIARVPPIGPDHRLPPLADPRLSQLNDPIRSTH